jgi:2-methylisocitrate lyase-like PEP mutase family enzyme
MAGQIKAALDARSDPATVIMVRTDAIAATGLTPQSIATDDMWMREAELLFAGA